MKHYTFYLNNHNAYRITPLFDRVVRIQYNASGVFPQSLMERYEIIQTEFPEMESTFLEEGSSRKIQFGSFAITMNEDASFSVAENGKTLLKHILPFHPQEELGIGGKIAISPDERFYGCGYRPQHGIELRSQIIRNWCIPVANNGPSPFFVSSAGWGLFWNNSFETFFDFANRTENQLVFWSENGEFDIFLFAGSFKQMIMDYTTVTGKPSLMPQNGYGITVVNGEAETEISLIDKAERLRREKIPCDNFSISCEWMETYYDRSVNQKFNKSRYFVQGWMKEHNTFIAALKHFGIKSTLWTPCGYDLTHEQERRFLQKHPEAVKQPLYDRAVRKVANNDLSVDANSKLFRDDNLVPTARYDPYTIPEEPWYKHFQRFYDLGIIGLAEDGCMVQTTKIDHFYGNGHSYKDMHNLNQTLNSLQYFESYREYTGKRMFVRTPSTFVGHQKYCGTWCGDTTSGTSLVGLMQYSFQGQSNVTADMISTDPQQVHAGMFMPWVLNFCWGYPVWPWMLDEELRDIYVDYARLRYSLFPYVYNAARNAHETGISMCSAMIIHYPDDERFYDEYHQYLFGDSILVSALTDTIHLPEGSWIDFWTGAEYSNKETLTDAYPKDKGGYVFVKKGSILPLWENVQYVGEKLVDAMTIRVYPDAQGEYVLYEDDGITFQYEEGIYAETKFSYTFENGTFTMQIEPQKTDYPLPKKREYHVEVYTARPASLPEGMQYDEAKSAVCFTMHTNETRKFSE